MNRHQRILIAVLAIQVVLTVVVFWPKSALSASEPLLSGLKASDIVGMTMTETDGRTLELRQVTGEWVLPSADNYPVVGDKVTPVVDKLLAMDTGRLVARTASSHRRLQVSETDFVRRITLQTASGSRHTVYLGSSPTYNVSHVRVDGREETYLASGLSSWEFSAAPSAWINTSFVEFARDQLTEVQISNAKGTVVLTKDDLGLWSAQGLVGDQATDTIDLALMRSSSVLMTKPLGRQLLPEYGLDQPALTVTLKGLEQTVTWEAGALLPAEAGYVVRSSTSPYYVIVADYNLTVLLENGPAEYLKPTPTAASSQPTT